MSELTHYYGLTPTYLLNEMSLSQWWVYFNSIPGQERKVEVVRQIEPDFLDVKPKNGSRIIMK